MRDATRMLSTEQLRRERQRRGWSREYIAEQIGIADSKTIGRWERGVAFPSSYSLQRLCTLFGMSAQDLGLYQEEKGSLSISKQLLTRQSNVPLPVFPVYDPVLPLPLTEIGELVDRDELLSLLKQRLCTASGRPVLTAFNGLPGVGKTTLAIELAHDHDIQRQFNDGVLWAALGPRPDVPGQMRRWGTLLGITAPEMANLTHEDDLARTIRTTIGTRRILLVIDDVWKSEEALAFKVGGPNCAYLLTTRIPSVALHFANDGATTVRELSEEHGLRLLAHFAPGTITREPDAARALVQSVGGLPLALTLMGKYLQSQTYSGQPRRLQAALERLRHTEERLQLTALQVPLERHMGLPEGAPLSTEAAIGISYWQLDELSQRVLSMLSAFPAKPNSFSEEAALAVSAAPAEILDILMDAGLMECTGSGRYTLHQAIADYTSARGCDIAAAERMVEYLIGYVERHETDYDALEQEASNILAALQLAFERGMHTALIRGARDFSPFLQSRGMYKLAEIHLRRAEQAARSLDDTTYPARVWYHPEETADLCSATSHTPTRR